MEGPPPASPGGEHLVGIVSVGDLAVRADPHFAGSVMEETGPDGQPKWPGTELIRNSLSNEASIAESEVPDDILRDISQSGTGPAPKS